MKKKSARDLWKAKPLSERSPSESQSGAICDAIMKTPEFQQAKAIGLFAAREHEPNLRKIWVLKPQLCYFPKVNPDNGSMAFYSISKWSELQPGFKGILEPAAGARREWQKDDIVLVPGIAFDRYGGRVGSGLGYYDRFLAEEGKKARKWGVCLTSQISKERLDQEDFDARMEALISELGFHKIES